jgi:hypothetical protein
MIMHSSALNGLVKKGDIHDRKCADKDDAIKLPAFLTRNAVRSPSELPVQREDRRRHTAAAIKSMQANTRAIPAEKPIDRARCHWREESFGLDYIL